VPANGTQVVDLFEDAPLQVVVTHILRKGEEAVRVLDEVTGAEGGGRLLKRLVLAPASTHRFFHQRPDPRLLGGGQFL
jgi:hypothetical protein